MKPEEAQDLLADYLGGELDPTRTLEFEAYLAGDPVLAAEVESLRRTLATLRSLDEPAEAVLPRVSPAGVRRGRAWTLLRYAAVIVFAFGAGYLTRQSSGGTAGPPPSIVQPRPQSSEGAADWETRAAIAYARQPGRSGLARSLVALAQAVGKP